MRQVKAQVASCPPHARGGVPGTAAGLIRQHRSSPRTWGCSLCRLYRLLYSRGPPHARRGYSRHAARHVLNDGVALIPGSPWLRQAMDGNADRTADVSASSLKCRQRPSSSRTQQPAAGQDPNGHCLCWSRTRLTDGVQ